jgi:hypothetical protein
MTSLPYSSVLGPPHPYYFPPYFSATLVILVLSRIGLLGCVGEPVGTGKLFLHSYWFILSYGRVNGNSLVVLHYPPVSYINQDFGKLIALLATCIMLVTCLAYSSTLQMEETCSSKMSVDFQWSIWHYIPKDITLQGGDCTKNNTCLPDFSVLNAFSISREKEVQSTPNSLTALCFREVRNTHFCGSTTT